MTSAAPYHQKCDSEILPTPYTVEGASRAISGLPSGADFQAFVISSQYSQQGRKQADFQMLWRPRQKVINQHQEEALQPQQQRNPKFITFYCQGEPSTHFTDGDTEAQGDTGSYFESELGLENPGEEPGFTPNQLCDLQPVT